MAASAGAIVSSARDMSSWMLWHLSGGALPGNESLISRTSLWQTYAQYNKHFARHMTARDVRRTGRLAPVSSANQTTGEEPVDVHVAYDLGWMTSLYRGVYSLENNIVYAGLRLCTTRITYVNAQSAKLQCLEAVQGVG